MLTHKIVNNAGCVVPRRTAGTLFTRLDADGVTSLLEHMKYWGMQPRMTDYDYAIATLELAGRHKSADAVLSAGIASGVLRSWAPSGGLGSFDAAGIKNPVTRHVVTRRALDSVRGEFVDLLAASVQDRIGFGSPAGVQFP